MRFCYFLFTTLILAVGGTVHKSMGMEFSLTANQKPVEVKAFTHYHYVTLDISGKTEINLTSGSPVQSCEISPRNLGIENSISGNKVSFTLDKPGYVMVRINDAERFFVFAEEPEKVL